MDLRNPLQKLHGGIPASEVFVERPDEGHCGIGENHHFFLRWEDGRPERPEVQFDLFLRDREIDRIDVGPRVQDRAGIVKHVIEVLETLFQVSGHAEFVQMPGQG